MADVSIRRADGSELTVIMGQLWTQRAGNWSIFADQINDTEALPIDERVTVVWLESEWSGYVLRSGVADGFGQAVIMGGSGGLTKQLSASGYDNQIVARMVVDDILRESGESLSLLSAAAVSSALGSWVRTADSAGAQLSALTDAIGAIWRMQSDGSLYIGSDSWPVVSPDWDHTIPQDGWHPQHRCLELIPSSVEALPGQTYSREVGGVQITGRISSAVYRIGQSGPSARLYFIDDRVDPAHSDNLAEPLRKFVRETMRGHDLQGTFYGVAKIQRSDGTLDFEPDDKRYPIMSGVRIRVPVPGAKLTIPAGSRCQLVFEGADVQQRVATLYEPGSDVKAVARVDDSVDVGTLVFSTVANGVLTGTYTPPGGAPIPFSLGATINLRGKITSGSPHFSLPRA